MQGKFYIGFVVTGLLAAIPALAADSILEGPRPGPCAGELAGPDYVPGVDATGQIVPRADLGAPRVAVPDQIFVPLPTPGPNRQQGRGGRAGPQNPNGPYAAIDGRRLDPLVNPEPCPAPPPARRR